MVIYLSLNLNGFFLKAEAFVHSISQIWQFLIHKILKTRPWMWFS